MLGIYRKPSYDIYESPLKYKLIRNVKISIVLILVTGLILLNLNTYYKLKLAKESFETIENLYYKQSSSLNQLQVSLSGLQEKYYEENLNKLLSKEELSKLAKLNWKYSLMVNDINVTENTITVEDKDIFITLTELKDSSKPLPKSISAYGSLSNAENGTKFHSYFKVESSSTYELYIDTEGETTYAYYDFYGVPSGSTITLKIAQPLIERLGLSSDTIQITVK
jgi:hypothetical protein